MDEKFELIMCIINAGFSDAVMDAARSCGARGGTVIHARGTARQEVETRFNISIHPEKEVVLILASNKIKDDITCYISRSWFEFTWSRYRLFNAGR